MKTNPIGEIKRSGDIVYLGHIGVGGQKGYVYSVTGVSTTELSTQHKDPIKILIRTKA